MEEKITKVNYVEVTNRNNGFTGYTLNDGTRRQFNVKETKQIPLEELKTLSQDPGGEYLLRNYLIVGDMTALEFLNITPEPEYWYTDKEIKMLLNEGTLDQLEDALNFAPDGVVQMIKDIAVKDEVPDIRKRDLIYKHTGFNVNNAITVNKVLEQEDAPEIETKTERKAVPIVAEGRKVERKSKYSIPTK